MNTKFWSVFAAMISTGLLAQQVTNPPPAALIQTPAPAAAVTTAAPAMEAQPAPASPAKSQASPAPASKRAPRKAVKAAELRTVPLVPGPAVVSVSPLSHVMVRGQARLRGEIITRLTNGEPVTVIEEIRLKNSGPEEPSAWAKIVLPDKAHLWVNGTYIDPATKTVKAQTLNLRGGPGENYSVLGTLHRGDSVTELGAKGAWIEIAATTNAYAFMAAQYLTQETPALAAATPEAVAGPTETTPTPETITGEPTVASAPTNTPAVPEVAAGTNEAASVTTNEVASATPEVEVPPPPRIVQREGIVRGSISIQAPTPFELMSLDNHRTMDYLYTTSTNLDLSRYKGLHIVVTGEEGLDERWKNTPVIVVRRIQVLD